VKKLPPPFLLRRYPKPSRENGPLQLPLWSVDSVYSQSVFLNSLLADDVLFLIFIQLDDPLSLSQTSKRFNRISKESYTRALYFITRYGHQHAMYWALGRGKLVDKQMLDVSTMRLVGCLMPRCQTSFANTYHPRV
jgi:hypothetical protein